MECPICRIETVNYVDVSNIDPSLHGPLFELCSCWHHSPGVCWSCIDELDMRLDPMLQKMLYGHTPPKKEVKPFTVNLSKHETPLWFHEDDLIRLWFRGELRKKVRLSAYNNHHLYWSIADDNRVLLDYGEIVYETEVE